MERRGRPIPAYVIGVVSAGVVLTVALLAKHVDGSADHLHRRVLARWRRDRLDRVRRTDRPDRHPLRGHRRQRRRGVRAGRRIRRSADPARCGMGGGDSRVADGSLAARCDRRGIDRLPPRGGSSAPCCRPQAALGETCADARGRRGQRLHRQQDTTRRGPPARSHIGRCCDRRRVDRSVHGHLRRSRRPRFLSEPGQRSR